MPSLKSLKNRIKSVKSTQKITKAMKMVAASKLKKAREIAEAAAPYATNMENITSILRHSNTDNSLSALTKSVDEAKSYLLIINTADRGLCGGFNGAILKLVRQDIENLLAQGKNVKLVCLGKRGYDILYKKYHANILSFKLGLSGKNVSFKIAEDLATETLKGFEIGEFDAIYIYYNKLKSVISQIPTKQQILPLPILLSSDVVEPFECEPNSSELLSIALSYNIAAQIYLSILESNASEQAARMTAMDNATRNCGELIKNLGLLYNRTRQAYITKELIEIISGAEAV